MPGNINAIEKLWKETVAEFYPENGDDETEIKGSRKIDHSSSYPEERIDEILKQKLYNCFLFIGKLVMCINLIKIHVSCMYYH